MTPKKIGHITFVFLSRIFLYDVEFTSVFLKSEDPLYSGTKVEKSMAEELQDTFQFL